MIVLDTSVVFDLLHDQQFAVGALERIGSLRMHVPHAIDTEFWSILRRRVLRGEVAVDRARRMIADYADLPLARWTFAPDLRMRAFELRDTVAAYDAAFLTLAESLDYPLLTRDGRLARSTGHHARIELI